MPKNKIYCSDCGCEMERDERLYFFQSYWLCRDCLENELQDLSTDDLIALLDIDSRPAEDFCY